MSEQPGLIIPPVEVRETSCAHCPNNPDYIRWRNEQYKAQFREMEDALIKSCPESLRGVNSTGAWQIINDRDSEDSIWKGLSDEEKDWVKKCITADLLLHLHYIGQIPPCALKTPTVVDCDFTHITNMIK